MRKLPVMILLALSAILIATALVQALPSSENKAVWTRAICSGNYCIDIRITCVNDELIDIEPITEGVYFSDAWNDPRPEDFKNEWCNS